MMGLNLYSLSSFARTSTNVGSKVSHIFRTLFQKPSACLRSAVPVFKQRLINALPAEQISRPIGCVFAFRVSVTEEGLEEWEESSTWKVSRCKVT